MSSAHKKMSERVVVVWCMQWLDMSDNGCTEDKRLNEMHLFVSREYVKGWVSFEAGTSCRMLRMLRIPHLGALKGLPLHDVAPVARGVADGQEDGLIFVPRLGEGFLAPRVPLDGVGGVL